MQEQDIIYKQNNTKPIIFTIVLVIIILLIVLTIFYVLKNQYNNPVVDISDDTGKTPKELSETIKEINLQSTLLATIPIEYIQNNYDIRGEFLDGGRKIFYYAYVPGESNTVFLNGDPNNIVESYNLLPGGLSWQSAVYLKKKDDKYSVIRDGKEEYYGAIDRNIATSKNGKTIGYIVDKNYVVINGKPDKKYTQVSGISISPDEKHVAYISFEGDKNTRETNVILDGKKSSNDYNLISRPTFNPNSKSIAYIALRDLDENNIKNSKCFAVVNKKEIAEFECTEENVFMMIFNNEGDAGLITFSPDGKSVAFSIGGLLIIDGKQVNKYSKAFNLVFSPDSKHVAYYASSKEDPKKLFIVLDGKEIKKPDESNFGSGDLVWNPDSKSFAYRIIRREGQSYKVSIVLRYLNDNEKIGKEYNRIEHIIFSPRGERMVYVAVRLEQSIEQEGAYISELILVDGYTGNEIDEGLNLDLLPVFSNDGKSIAYIVGHDKKSRVARKSHIVINGEPGIDYDQIWTNPIFSQDGKSVGYGILKGNELWWIVDKVKKLQ
ncbi:MAG: hypothetical protein AABW83_03995 [Nanoarchaeota archaeon]